MRTESRSYFAAQAWIGGAWVKDVLLSVDAAGRWAKVQPGCGEAQRANAEVLKGAVLPGLVNAHSHAFQRAIAGLSERRGAGASDDFWSWRDRMYSVARRINPDQLEAIASYLYAELLEAGYTQVCEFHYVHNAVDGAPDADPLEMSLALLRAAQKVGIGLSLLPALYMRSGFGAAGLREDQRRFASTPDSVLLLRESLLRQAAQASDFNVGVALHSLRAADMAAIRETSAVVAAGSVPRARSNPRRIWDQHWAWVIRGWPAAYLW